MWIYYCKACGKILGESIQGKIGMNFVAVNGSCCYHLSFSQKEIERNFEEYCKERKIKFTSFNNEE